jgi:hypothetical protein
MISLALFIAGIWLCTVGHYVWGTLLILVAVSGGNNITVPEARGPFTDWEYDDTRKNARLAKGNKALPVGRHTYEGLLYRLPGSSCGRSRSE